MTFWICDQNSTGLVHFNQKFFKTHPDLLLTPAVLSGGNISLSIILDYSD